MKKLVLNIINKFKPKQVELDVGEITLRPITWKEENECRILADQGNMIKESIYLVEVEKRITNLTPEQIDSLSRADGMKLRAAITEYLNEQSSDIKN